MSQDSDLSAYERVRLENIRKNNEFLASLGLFPSAPKASVVKKEADTVIREKKIRQKRAVEDEVLPEKRRRSSRLSGQVVPLEELQDSEDEEKKPVDKTAFYECQPQESDQLDDFEFQAYAELRRWRLLRSRGLGIESFKIFPNRTFCEMIRLRRNNANWAVPAVDGASIKTESDVKDENATQAPPAHVEQETKSKDVIVYDPALVDDLTDCFGIGGGKTKEGGFAWEALAVLNRAKVCALLRQSRELKPAFDEE